jgi:hypothetical protein
VSDFCPAIVSDRLRAFSRFLDLSLGQPGRLHVYGSARPAKGASAGAGVLPLATLVLYQPCLDGVVGNVLTLLAPVSASVALSGDAVWARFENGAGQWAYDCDVSLPSGTAPVRLTTVSGTLALYAGGQLSCLPITLTEA